MTDLPASRRTRPYASCASRFQSRAGPPAGRRSISVCSRRPPYPNSAVLPDFNQLGRPPFQPAVGPSELRTSRIDPVADEGDLFARHRRTVQWHARHSHQSPSEHSHQRRAGPAISPGVGDDPMFEHLGRQEILQWGVPKSPGAVVVRLSIASRRLEHRLYGFEAAGVGEFLK